MAVVHLMLEQWKNGQSICAITRSLNSQKIRPRKAKQWSQTTIGFIVKRQIRTSNCWTRGSNSNIFRNMKYKVKSLDFESATKARNAVVEVYQSVYSLPPYNETEKQVESFSASWNSRVKKSEFLFVSAEDEIGRMAGFAYGWKSVPGDAWNIKLTEQLGESSTQWLSDCFEFVDLAVSPSAQGFGLGRDLTKALFDLVNAKTAILLTHQNMTKASGMYLKNGWIQLRENFEVAPGKLYQIMGKVL